MTWLLSATRWWLVLGTCLVAGALSGLLSGATAAVPSLTHGGLAPVPVVAVAALTPAVMLVWGWSGLPLKAAAASVRLVPAVLVGMVLVTCGAYALGALVTGGVPAALEAVRNAAGLMGLSLVGQRVRGERGAALASLGYLVAAFAFGTPSGNPDPARWAWILLKGGDAYSLGLATLLLAAGLAVTPGLPRAAAVHG